MARNFAQRYDLYGETDPRTVAVAAQKGTLFRLLPPSGDPTLLIKEDDGLTTNWLSVDQLSRTKEINANSTLSAYTDRFIFCDTSVLALVITLPLGQDGLQYTIKDISNNAGANNVTFLASGLNTIEAGADITVNGGSRNLVFYDTQWWVV